MSSPKTIWDELKDHEFAHAYFDEFLNTYLATQIKTLRECRNLTQAELGELAGMAQERISLMENVNYSSWTVSTLRKLAKAFGLRLKVSFESFGTGLSEIRYFARKSLERKSLLEEIKEHEDARARNQQQFQEAVNTEQLPPKTPLVQALPENLNPLVRPNRKMDQAPQVAYQQ